MKVTVTKKELDFILWSLSTDARQLKEYGQDTGEDQSKAINEYLKVINNLKKQLS